jgi:hypothetical protein
MEDEMVGACITREEMRNAWRVRLESLKGRNLSEDLGVDWRDLREMGWEGVDWIHLSHDRNRLQDLVNAVMNIQVL